ncbi:MAG: hypothetical protein J6B52_00870 [Clostridia bacterium]|nr:hypothetical protein [Clostridia bacterium]
MFETSKMSMVKGLGIGLAVGTAAAVASTKMMTKKGRKACKKNAARCMKSMESVIDAMMG